MRFLLVLLTSIVAASTHADWQLDPAASKLYFVTTKASHVAEVHQFKRLEGKVDSQGNAELTIDLSSVDTGIEVRDQRMQEMLFEVAKYPKATLSAKVDAGVLALPVGKGQNLTMDGKLSIHGQTAAVSSIADVQRLSANELSVVSAKPIIVNAKDLDLVAGVEKLREVAGLPSISYSVIVTYDLVFKNK